MRVIFCFSGCIAYTTSNKWLYSTSHLHGHECDTERIIVCNCYTRLHLVTKHKMLIKSKEQGHYFSQLTT